MSFVISWCTLVFLCTLCQQKQLKMFDSNMKNVHTQVLNQCVGAKHVHRTLCELFEVCFRFLDFVNLQA